MSMARGQVMRAGIEIQCVAEEQVRVDHRGQQVVGRGNGVKVAVEVQIDFLAGLDLRQSPAGGAALHAEDRAQRRLARGENRFLPMRSRPCARPMETTVLPSPEVVGVVAVTRINLPRTGKAGLFREVRG